MLKSNIARVILLTNLKWLYLHLHISFRIFYTLFIYVKIFFLVWSVFIIIFVQVRIFSLIMRDIIIYLARWWERYLSKRNLIKHTCSWRHKLIVPCSFVFVLDGLLQPICFRMFCPKHCITFENMYQLS